MRIMNGFQIEMNGLPDHFLSELSFGLEIHYIPGYLINSMLPATYLLALLAFNETGG